MKDGGPAFPVKVFSNIGGKYIQERGMTLRDYFAAKAMQGVIISGRRAAPTMAAADAYKYAEAMLKAREKKPQ